VVTLNKIIAPAWALIAQKTQRENELVFCLGLRNRKCKASL